MASSENLVLSSDSRTLSLGRWADLADMSNNSANSSNLVIAQKVVKQLRLEASVRRIKVNKLHSERLIKNCSALGVTG